jgi:lysophospholipase L1-like esterase
MKTVLCYGDSLTWGHNAETLCRHEYEDRWPTTLAGALAPSFRVIAEGLGGRTTAFDDFLSGADRNGARILPTILSTHAPIDLIVIMLGSNDMKPSIHGSAVIASYGMRRLVEIVRGHAYPFGGGVPKIVLVAPPHIVETRKADYAEMLGAGATESPKLATFYQTAADEMGCSFFDAATVAKCAPLDGVHVDAENTRKIGQALAPLVRAVLEL